MQADDVPHEMSQISFLPLGVLRGEAVPGVNGIPSAACAGVSRPSHRTLWVPNWSSTLCDLGIFVDQAAESIATSDANLGG
jgi:hypothetical protein